MKKISRHTFWTCCAATSFLSICLNTTVLADDSGPVHRPLFDSDSTLAVTIEGPLNTVMRNRDETEEFPAVFKFLNADGSESTLDIKLRVRGKFRRKRETCNFAPLRVNFKKGQTVGTAFEGQNTIKLVTDCQSSKKAFQQYLLKEYLTYKIYNLLTDNSFGARLLRITYVDTDRDNKSRESYGFFIEEKNHIADRTGLDRLRIPKTKYSALDPVVMNLVNVYEYFIANTDYSMVLGPAGADCCHNTVLYQKDGNPIVSIPYDFDHAGLVDAPYAAPNPKFKIKAVTSRIYRGRCTNNVQLDATFRLFLDKRDAISRLVTELDGFDERSIKGAMNFIDGFYEDITTPKDVERKFLKKCS